MANIILLYNNFADIGTLSGGSWTLPLTYMQDPRPTKRAQSANLNPTSTRFDIVLTGPKSLRAIVFGPTNFVGGENYRLEGFSDAAFTSLVTDTGIQAVGSPPIATFDTNWEDSNWWTGSVAVDEADAGGVWVIHVFGADQTAQYWRILIDAQANPDGVVKIGRLFMGQHYIPSLNFLPASNRFGFVANTTVNKAAGGARFYNRRPSARTFEFAFERLPQDEVHSDVYRITRIADIDQQVFVIPDPDDLIYRTRRSFLGNLEELPDWALSSYGQDISQASTGFKITEAL